MNTIDTHNLLVSKENIQPLRQGRDTSKLSTALQAQTNSEMQHTLEKQRNEYEIRLRSSSSNDPLSDWCDYIHWIEQSFPTQPREGKLHVVLQKCLNKFKDNERYKNDVRFVKLCIKYAEIEETTVELLSQIHRHGIGVKCAELYIAWAEKYATSNCFKKANVIYEKGIQNHAEPLGLLKEAHQNFHAFLIKRMLNEKEEFKPTFLEPAPSESRQPYNILKPVTTGQTDVVSNVRIGPNVKGSPGKLRMNMVQDKKPKSNIGIKIFQDDENDYASAEPKARLEKIPSKKKSSKENFVKPGPWVDKKNKKVPFTAGPAAPVPFQVHRDEDESETNGRLQSVPTSVLKPHSKKDFDDTLSGVPLFYPEPYDPTKVSMYCKDQVYAGGLEFQFEELRAIDYRKKYDELKKKSKATVHKPNIQSCDSAEKNSAQPVDDREQPPHMQPGISNENLGFLPYCDEDESKPDENKMKSRKSVVGKRSERVLQNKVVSEVAPQSSDYSMNNTINTKEALSEMQQLWFSKPASPLLQDNPVTKQAGKSILKPAKPCFDLYIDESCLANFKNTEEPDAPLDLTIKPGLDDEPQSHEDIGQKCLNKPGVMDEENKENDVPVDYCGPVGKSTRKVSGVLTPAENIQSEPLSDVEVNEDEEEEDDVEFFAAAPCNLTGVTENLTRAFQFPRNESTPNPQKSHAKKLDFNKSLFDYEDENCRQQCHKENPAESVQNDEPSKIPTSSNEIKQSTVGKEELCVKSLSVIVESSREYKSSSSGSGTSAFQSRSSIKPYPMTPMDRREMAFNNVTASHSGFHKTKGQSLTGYEASAESSQTGLRSRLSVVREFIVYEDENADLKAMNGPAPENFVEEPVRNPNTLQIENGENIDPFSDNVIDELLKIAKFSPKHHGSLNVVKVGSSLELGNINYNVKKVLGEGAYAKVFQLVNTSNGSHMIAKIQKPSFPWEYYINKELHRRIKDKKMAESFMKVESAIFFQNASVLLTTPVEYGTLLNTINLLKQNDQLSHILAVYFTIQILRILETLHSCQIIHADIKPDNFLMMNRNDKPHLQLIDFGRSIDMSLLPEGTTFTKVITTDDFTTTEMKMGKPWTYQVDLYGTANCSHCLLFGDYMKVTQKNGVWNISKIIPRYMARNEWKNYFSTLLNIENCDSIPKMSALIAPFEAILTDNKELDFSLNHLNNLLKNR